MHTPVLVDAPVLSPGRCAGCGSHKGPMVDTIVDYDLGLRLYVCIRTCLPAWAALAGYAAADTHAEIVGLLAASVAREAALEASIAEAAADSVGLLEAVATRAATVALERRPPAAKAPAAV